MCIDPSVVNTYPNNTPIISLNAINVGKNNNTPNMTKIQKCAARFQSSSENEKKKNDGMARITNNDARAISFMLPPP